MTYENYIKAQLVHYCVNEGWDGSIETPLAIAQTLKNRVDEGWGGGDWMKVIEAAPDYSGNSKKNRPAIEPRDLIFRSILQQIDEVYYGTSFENYVNDDQGQKALYFAELHTLDRDWFKQNIVSDPENHPMIAKVGQINFFA